MAAHRRKPDKRAVAARLDAGWMRKALSLARRAEGQTRPNPPVGAVVVQRSTAVGSGFHRRAGGPHAEALALQRAGPKARGATLYVTLEPCCTWGRTPPCTDAILSSGVRRVVVAVEDPNPRHQGRGLRALRNAGVRVDVGVGQPEAARLLAPFAKWVRTRRPYVTLKLGLTLDGRIADRNGRSRWITSTASRTEVQRLRGRADAILVGMGTATIDDPSLRNTERQPRWKRDHCYRVVVDSAGRLGLGAKLVTDPFRHLTIVATTTRCPVRRREAYGRRGVEVWVLPSQGGRVSLRALMQKLGRMGLIHVLCEGGGELAASLVKAGVVDDYVFFVAPRLLGGRGAPAFGGIGWPLPSAPLLSMESCRRVGPDLMITATAARSQAKGVRNVYRPD